MSSPSKSVPIETILSDIGAVGRVLGRIASTEGSAGNVSVYAGRQAPIPEGFTESEELELPCPVPELAGGTFVVTGSGRRLPEIADDPGASLGVLVVEPGGKSGRLWSSPRRRYERLTSELVSHLSVHRDQLLRQSGEFHAVVHAQPRQVVYLSHIDEYRDYLTFNRRLLRWQPETIISLPQGVGLVPFIVPGTAELMEASVAELRDHAIVVWAKHGVMARSHHSVKKACDFVEYLETAASYEVTNLLAGNRSSGLSPEELQRICEIWQIDQPFF